MSKELNRRKIQPLNLTARADHWVKGNPVTSRPDSGVDNSFPGLEFDQRNLDKRFLPAVELEYHRAVPPLCRRIIREQSQNPIDIADEELEVGLILWSVYGTFGHPDGGAIQRIESLQGLGGLESWRVIHDLEPGPVGLFIAPFSTSGPPQLSVDEQTLVNTALRGTEHLVERNPASGELLYAVLVGERATYLKDGVIDPDVFEPGDLTRSLCAPWQYDFADCGCFYWASNKPDMVAAEPDGDQMYNFQRIRDNEPPTGAPGSTPEERQAFLTLRGWRGDTLGHRQMVEEWETLPVVLRGVETSSYAKEPIIALPDERVLSRTEVIDRLHYLGTIEHGLMIEYLYAHYSIVAPRQMPDGDPVVARLFDAAKTLLGVAIDEMRHFRWVNEILRSLGEQPELGRFTRFEDIDGDGRALDHAFGLEPLNYDRLDWFIKVEQPSRLHDPDLAGDTIDGMYTRLLLSVQQSNEFSSAERRHLEHWLKLIIDEGHDHFQRFSRLKKSLAEVPGAIPLRLSTNPAPLDPGQPGKAAEIVVDKAYATVLKTLTFVFAQDTDTSEFLQAARFAMYALDDAAHEVIAQGGAPLFVLPTQVAGLSAPSGVTATAFSGMAKGSRRQILQAELLQEVEEAIQAMEAMEVGAGTGESMRHRYEQMLDGFEALP